MNKDNALLAMIWKLIEAILNAIKDMFAGAVEGE